MSQQNLPAKFAIIHNLDMLSAEQTTEYLRAVSVHFEIDPDLNAFDTFYMDAGDGTRKKVVYARKGTTDILRDLRGIEVSALVQHDGPGYVSFTATGKNKAGRQEIAVGAHNTEGLRGQKLADAVMTSQTRALRRLTLQFVGGGILDVSEVGTTADINASPASLATLAGSAAVIPPLAQPIAPTASRDITQVSFPRDGDAIKNLKAPEPSVLVDTIKGNETLPNCTVIPGIAAPATLTDENGKPKKKRTRRARNTVSLASPAQEPAQMEMPAGQIDAAGNITPVAVSPTPPAPVVTSAPVVVSAAPPAPVAPAPPVISAEKKKEFIARLSKYSQTILPIEGGMMPSNGVGGVTMKLRKFAEMLSGGEKNLNEQQMDTVLTFLDEHVRLYGAPALVAHINKVLEVKS